MNERINQRHMGGKELVHSKIQQYIHHCEERMDGFVPSTVQVNLIEMVSFYCVDLLRSASFSCFHI
jgi:hypothetical protein